jgi:hypothetical protein
MPSAKEFLEASKARLSKSSAERWTLSSPQRAASERRRRPGRGVDALLAPGPLFDPRLAHDHGISAPTDESVSPNEEQGDGTLVSARGKAIDATPQSGTTGDNKSTRGGVDLETVVHPEVTGDADASAQVAHPGTTGDNAPAGGQVAAGHRAQSARTGDRVAALARIQMEAGALPEGAGSAASATTGQHPGATGDDAEAEDCVPSVQQKQSETTGDRFAVETSPYPGTTGDKTPAATDLSQRAEEEERQGSGHSGVSSMNVATTATINAGSRSTTSKWIDRPILSGATGDTTDLAEETSELAVSHPQAVRGSTPIPTGARPPLALSPHPALGSTKSPASSVPPPVDLDSESDNRGQRQDNRGQSDNYPGTTGDNNRGQRQDNRGQSDNYPGTTGDNNRGQVDNVPDYPTVCPRLPHDQSPVETPQAPPLQASVPGYNRLCPRLQPGTKARFNRGQLPTSDQQITVLTCLVVDQERTGLGHTTLLSRSAIATRTGISQESVKKAIQRLVSAGQVEVRESKAGRFSGGTSYHVPHSVEVELRAFNRGQARAVSGDSSLSTSEGSNGSLNRTIITSTPASAKELAEVFQTWLERFEAGELLDANALLKLWRDGAFDNLEDLAESAEHIVAYAKSDQGQGLRKAWVVKTLANGYYARPAGFVSWRERQLEQKRRRAAERLEQRKIEFDADFELWLAGTTADARRKIVEASAGQGASFLSPSLTKATLRDHYARVTGMIEFCTATD